MRSIEARKHSRVVYYKDPGQPIEQEETFKHLCVGPGLRLVAINSLRNNFPCKDS